jgi:hypothetical protein
VEPLGYPRASLFLVGSSSGVVVEELQHLSKVGVRANVLRCDLPTAPLRPARTGSYNPFDSSHAAVRGVASMKENVPNVARYFASLARERFEVRLIDVDRLAG